MTAVEAEKAIVSSLGHPLNQVPAAESAVSAIRVGTDDLDAWKASYETQKEPNETGRTPFLKSLCWVK